MGERINTRVTPKVDSVWFACVYVCDQNQTEKEKIKTQRWPPDQWPDLGKRCWLLAAVLGLRQGCQLPSVAEAPGRPARSWPLPKELAPTKASSHLPACPPSITRAPLPGG